MKLIDHGIKSVAIFGSADVPREHGVTQDAFALAQACAREQVRVVNGGGPGVMEAVTRGAESAGGSSLTVTFAPKNARFFEGQAHTNIADEEIFTHNYAERINALIDNSDAFVILRGGTGTLSEWSLVWLYAHIYFGYHKPFVLVGEFWHELLDVVVRHFYIEQAEMRVFRIVATTEEVLPALHDLAEERDHMNLRSGAA